MASSLLHHAPGHDLLRVRPGDSCSTANGVGRCNLLDQATDTLRQAERERSAIRSDRQHPAFAERARDRDLER